MSWYLSSISHKLLVRFGLAFALILFFNYIASSYFSNISTNAQTARMNIRKTLVSFVRLQAAFKDFLVEDLTKQEFFEISTTANLNEYRKLANNYTQELEKLSNFHKQENKFESLLTLDSTYRHGAEKLAAKYHQFGFKSWGLEGRIQSSIQNFNRILYKNQDLKTLLSLIQLKPDRNDATLAGASQYKSVVLNKLQAIRKLTANRSESLKLNTLLNHYEKDLLQYADLTIEINGYLMQLQGTSDKIESEIIRFVEEAEIYAKDSVQNSIYLSQFGLVFFLVLSGSFLYFQAESIVKPLKKLQKVASEVGQGNLSVAADIHNKNQDEIWALSRSMNDMIQGLRQLDSQTKLAAIGEFSANVAHEISTPLCQISLLTSKIEVLSNKDSINKKDIAQVTEKITTAIDRIIKIINGLKALARGSDNDAFSDLNVRESINEAILIMQERFKIKDVRLSLIEPISPDLVIDARSTQVSQVLINLLGNACDAVEHLEDRWAQISVVDLGDSIEISITDSGNGVPVEIQQRLFDPLFTTKEVGKGTGLGLSLSLKIIKNHSGELSIDSSYKNTRFVIQLPKKIAA